MIRSKFVPTVFGVLLTSSLAGQEARKSARYEDLVSLFSEWRSFQKPKLVKGVPDYTVAGMAAQRAGLAVYQRRLAAIDPSDWPIPQQVDYYLVRAEMNGLDFDHRVLRPWSRNPAFYVTVFAEESDQPAREGPFAEGAVELWSYPLPLSPQHAAQIAAGLRTVPKLLKQAKANLTGNARDLWIFGAKSIHQQSADLAQWASRPGAAEADADLEAEVERAWEATDAFADWLDSKAAAKTGPSGVGIRNYDWYLKNVQLAPYTWREEVALMERELARAQASLALEEKHNANLPAQEPIASAEEHARRFGEAIGEYMDFLKDNDILTVREYMEPALRARIGAFSPGPREFFSEVDYRDPELLRTHGYHWFDKARMARDPHPSPIRKGALLYNIFVTRTEGHATGWEELMTLAGMVDARPRTRELLYVLLAQRAARALGDLRMHANELSIEQAAAFAVEQTPRGWLRLDGNLVRAEQHLYLQQPGYGTSYLIGKIEIEKLLAERKRQLGDDFTIRRFMDELDAAGLIPTALIRWQLTGRLQDDVARRLAILH